MDDGNYLHTAPVTFLVSIVISIICISLFAGCTTTTTVITQPVPAASVNTQDNGQVSIILELAITSEERQTGLMHREQLDWYSGMLFVFDVDAPYAFWMKNTLIYLDMLYISYNGTIVHIRHNAEPLNETAYIPPALCRYVLEVNGGFCEAEGIAVGDEVDFTGF